ncbi:MAG: hypothetical protein HQ574_08680 [Chloroflexi bacterium]|nr:hypothetical protein [Chloroflexota bacterium]
MDKVGFHYRLDRDHYTERDLGQWLPRLKQLDASWIVLNAPIKRAIPEGFIATLKAESIEPVLHFQITPRELPSVDEMILLYENYQKWGVKYVILFDKPNQQESWGSEAWAQSDLTERFLDGFLPLAEAAVALGLVPVFPPLEPGGDYWDTIFLRGALDGIKRRASKPLLNRLMLSAYARLNARPLSWGGGGPQCWPEAQPYHTPESSQDQQGFRIAEWYLTLSETVLEKKLPTLLLGIQGSAPEGQDNTNNLINSARLIARQVLEGEDALPEEIIGGAFWVLAGDEENSWYSLEGSPKPIVVAYTREGETGPEAKSTTGSFRIAHYLLLPSFEWGIADWHLKVTRPFIKRHRPTIGFSLEEAFQAEQVTVVGGEDQFSETDITQLRNQGCLVRRVEGDGTKIASLLAAI